MDSLAPRIHVPGPAQYPVRVPVRSRRFVTAEVLARTELKFVAAAVELTVEQLLEDVERWAASEGFVYGIKVVR